MSGDSSDPNDGIRFRELLAHLDSATRGESFPFTLILNDPLANVYIEGVEGDPALAFVPYERTEEQNIDMGISDMNVDNYEV
jgi:zinc finger protein